MHLCTPSKPSTRRKLLNRVVVWFHLGNQSFPGSLVVRLGLLMMEQHRQIKENGAQKTMESMRMAMQFLHAFQWLD
jgi:hypothetical protein